MQENKQKKYANPFIATATGIIDQFRRQPVAGRLLPADRFDGLTVFVDGASSGLGFAVAREVANRGARLIMACRSGIPHKGEAIRQLTGNNEVYMSQVDYRDLHSINRMVSDLKSRFSGIDILILNAGVVPKQSRRTPQDLEEMFMVNYFSKFILVKGLQDAGFFEEGGMRRVVIVSSESHRNAKEIGWGTFGSFTAYSIKGSMEHYGHNKLLLTTFARELARRLNPGDHNGCQVFAMCPGPVNSNIAREAPRVFQPLLRLVFSIFFKSPEMAAIPVIYLAASGDLKGKEFDYLFQMTRKAIDPKASDPSSGKKLWEQSEELLDRISRSFPSSGN